jgi:hypothetical protein
MYRVATHLLATMWGKTPEMVDALSVLLLTWNGPFYRFGMFDQNALESWLGGHWAEVSTLRERQIISFSQSDESLIANLFQSLLVALEIASGRRKGRRSPVAVAKALHLLAPEFLPLWDNAIAESYGCPYAKNPAEAYIRFCKLNRATAARLAPMLPTSESPCLSGLMSITTSNSRTLAHCQTMTEHGAVMSALVKAQVTMRRDELR